MASGLIELCCLAYRAPRWIGNLTGCGVHCQKLGYGAPLELYVGGRG